MTSDSSDAPQAHHTPQLDQLRKQAKKLLQSARDKNAAAIDRLRSTVPRLAGIAVAEIPEAAQLADAQHAIARAAGFESWPKLKRTLERAEPAQYFMAKFREAILAHDETVVRSIRAEHFNEPELFAGLRRQFVLTRSGDNAALMQLARENPEVSAGLPLVVALCVGNAELVAEMIETLESLTRPVRQQMAAAADSQGDSSHFEKHEVGDPGFLLMCCASPFFKDSPECATGILRCAELLLEWGADANSHTVWEEDGVKSKITALYHASVMGNTAMMKLLLECGADPNDGESVPHAAEMNMRESLDVLLEYGADISGRLPVFNNTTLHFLALQLWDRSRYDKILGGIRWLLEHGADPNVTTHPSLETPLHAAAQSARGSEAVALLIEHGADINARRADGRLALAIAVRNGHQEIIELLQRPGAGVPRSDRLLGAAMRGAEEEARQILSEYPNILAEFSEEDRGMFANAIFLGDKNSLRLMTRLGFDLAWENDWGGTPLHLAAWFGKVEMVRELIALGAPINVRDSRYGSSPLAWAGHGSTNSHSADDDYIAIVQLLIDAGSTKETAVNKWNEKPSSMASKPVAKLLRQNGF